MEGETYKHKTDLTLASITTISNRFRLDIQIFPTTSQLYCKIIIQCTLEDDSVPFGNEPGTFKKQKDSMFESLGNTLRSIVTTNELNITTGSETFSRFEVNIELKEVELKPVGAIKAKEVITATRRILDGYN